MRKEILSVEPDKMVDVIYNFVRRGSKLKGRPIKNGIHKGKSRYWMPNLLLFRKGNEQPYLDVFPYGSDDECHVCICENWIPEREGVLSKGATHLEFRYSLCTDMDIRYRVWFEVLWFMNRENVRPFNISEDTKRNFIEALDRRYNRALVAFSGNKKDPHQHLKWNKEIYDYFMQMIDDMTIGQRCISCHNIVRKDFSKMPCFCSKYCQNVAHHMRSYHGAGLDWGARV